MNRDCIFNPIFENPHGSRQPSTNNTTGIAQYTAAEDKPVKVRNLMTSMALFECKGGNKAGYFGIPIF